MVHMLYSISNIFVGSFVYNTSCGHWPGRIYDIKYLKSIYKWYRLNINADKVKKPVDTNGLNLNSRQIYQA